MVPFTKDPKIHRPPQSYKDHRRANQKAKPRCLVVNRWSRVSSPVGSISRTLLGLFINVM